jgi:hypothetical protein
MESPTTNWIHAEAVKFVRQLTDCDCMQIEILLASLEEGLMESEGQEQLSQRTHFILHSDLNSAREITRQVVEKVFKQ